MKPPKHPCPDCGARHHTPGQQAAIRAVFDHCAECGQRCFDDYMVHDSVWALSGIPRGQVKGVLHLRCLEKRVGRKLVAEDFTDSPVNDVVRWALA